MTFKDQVLTACQNMGRRKVRSFLASLGVVVGILTIVILISLASGVRQHINRQFESVGLDQLVVVPSGKFPFPGRGGPMRMNNQPVNEKKIITPDDVTRWKKWPGVTDVDPVITLPGSVNLELKWQEQTQPVRISEPVRRPGQSLWEAKPETLAGDLELKDTGTIVLSAGTAGALGLDESQFADLVGQNAELVLRTSRDETQGFELKVQGVSSESNTTVRVSTADCLAMKCWWFNNDNLLENEGYDSVVVHCADVSHAKELTLLFREDGAQVFSLDMFVEMADRIVVTITIMLVLLASVALLVASIGIVNTMVMAVYERTREIGVLKALGASGRNIQCIVIIESGFIGLLGGVLGLLAGWSIGLLLNQGIGWYLRHRDVTIQSDFFVVTPVLALSAIVFATLIGITAGWLPSRRASGLDPLEALRHE